MLRLRICPQCSNKVESLTALFCYHCGAELPEATAKEAGKEEKKVPDDKQKVGIRFSNWKLLVSFFLLLSILLVGIILLRASPSQGFKMPQGSQLPPNEVLFKGTGLTQEGAVFGKGGFAEITPAEIDLFLEGRRPSFFLSRFLSEEEERLFERIVGLSLEEAQSYLEDDFALVRQATASAFLGRVKDKNFVEKKVKAVEALEEKPNFKPHLLKDFLIITNSSDLYRQIEEASRKLKLNLSLSAPFAEARKALPEEGQAFVFAAEKNVLADVFAAFFGREFNQERFEKLKGTAFVFLPKEEGVLVKGVPDEH